MMKIVEKGIKIRLANLGLKIPEILLPRKGIDLEKWVVIACDQFTQDKEYWEKVKNKADNSPSTLNLILPELYLEEKGNETWIKTIHLNMKTYLDNGVFAPKHCCGIYLERSTPFNEKRRGLVLAIDLEEYDWKPEARPLIRATEGTVKERLPPRMDIRRNAPMEISHTLLLIDDEKNTLIPELGKEAAKNSPLYNSPLMLNSGSVSGWALDTEEIWTQLAEGLEKLAGKSKNQYGIGFEKPFLFAVGDGNHSLAAAKGIWEEYKAACPGDNDHPLRYALVELINLHDPGLSFRPIHRLLFNVNLSALLEAFSKLPGFSYQSFKSTDTDEFLGIIEESRDCLGIVSSTPKGIELILVKTRIQGMAVAILQPLLDNFSEISMDYIHGEDEVVRLVSDSVHKKDGRNLTGLIFPPIQRDGFFKTIAQNGPLPRKSFSMGESIEKRFYLECRKLF